MPNSPSRPARARRSSIKSCTARSIRRLYRCRSIISNVTTDLLFSDEIVAIAHPKHPLAKEKFISAATLAGEKLILGERGGNTRRMIDEFFRRQTSGRIS